MAQLNHDRLVFFESLKNYNISFYGKKNTKKIFKENGINLLEYYGFIKSDPRLEEIIKIIEKVTFDEVGEFKCQKKYLVKL